MLIMKRKIIIFMDVMTKKWSLYLKYCSIEETSSSSKHSFKCYACKKRFNGSYLHAFLHLSGLGDRRGTRCEPCLKPNPEASQLAYKKALKKLEMNDEEVSCKRKQSEISNSFGSQLQNDCHQAILIFFTDCIIFMTASKIICLYVKYFSTICKTFFIGRLEAEIK